MIRLAALLVAAFLAVPVAALAHPGHTHKVMGVVSMVHENHLEVTDAKGKTTTFTLAEKTRIRRAKAIVKTSDIKVGDRVVVTTRETKDKAGKSTIIVVDVQLGAAAATSQR
jgi:hypothetical protein